MLQSARSFAECPSGHEIELLLLKSSMLTAGRNIAAVSFLLTLASPSSAEVDVVAATG